jgi:light-regulated signal transduction histidine kinase (bacteriophytochrome)
MASHDLQAPLRKIRMFSDRLVSDHQQGLNKDGQLYLSRIQQVAKRMQDLINDILRFSKMSGEQEAFQEVDLNGVFREVLSEMEGPIREKNAEIILDILPVLPANAGLMVPLFANLLNNSLKYSKRQIPPLIQIRHELTPVNETAGGKETDAGYCRIYIEDNGIGFDQKYAEQIFDMFRRLHSNAEYEGTGIGLALCKKIVEKHKGFISARGRPGEGALFIVSLPMKRVKKELMVG